MIFPVCQSTVRNQKINSGALVSSEPTQSIVMASFTAKGLKVMLHEQVSLGNVTCNGTPSFLVGHTSLRIVKTVGPLFRRASISPFRWPSLPSAGVLPCILREAE